MIVVSVKLQQLLIHVQLLNFFSVVGVNYPAPFLSGRCILRYSVRLSHTMSIIGSCSKLCCGNIYHAWIGFSNLILVPRTHTHHYNDVSNHWRVDFYPIVYSVADPRKYQSSGSLAFVWGIHRWPANSSHKRPVTRKIFPPDDVIMILAKCGVSPDHPPHGWTSSFHTMVYDLETTLPRPLMELHNYLWPPYANGHERHPMKWIDSCWQYIKSDSMTNMHIGIIMRNMWYIQYLVIFVHYIKYS